MKRNFVIYVVISAILILALATALYLSVRGKTESTGTSWVEQLLTEKKAQNAFKSTLDPTSGRRGAINKAKPKAEAKRQPGQPTPYYGDLPSLALVNIRDAVLETIVDGLKKPWAMEFISTDQLLITESSGVLKKLDLPSGRIDLIEGMPAIPYGKGQIGLMDIALHPKFDSNQLIYFSHAVRADGEVELYATAVTRAELRGTTLHKVEQIFVATPYTKAQANFGGALEFDNEGYLYIGSGDRGEGVRSQKTNILNGKIIRLHDNGDTPADNPFVENPAIDDRIFAYGVRNPQGLVFDEVSGNLYETEHGPMGGDEVNIIEAGKNYGWDTISYGMRYALIRAGIGTSLENMEQPLFYYLPSIAISPLEIYRGAMFPEWEGHLLAGALKAQHVNMLDLLQDTVISEQRILGEMKGRVRDIKVATDGSIYFLLQTGGRLQRLSRDTTGDDLEHPKGRKGKDIYRMICASCHSFGPEQIPQITAPSAWAARIAQGKKTLYQHSIEGFGDMPAKGMCENCSDEEVEAAVDYMLKIVRHKN